MRHIIRKTQPVWPLTGPGEVGIEISAISPTLSSASLIKVETAAKTPIPENATSNETRDKKDRIERQKEVKDKTETKGAAEKLQNNSKRDKLRECKKNENHGPGSFQRSSTSKF